MTPYVGEIRMLAFSRVPTGWLACDGSTQPISEYQTLFTLLGTTYGGDGVTTFGLPDMRGQTPVHQGTGQGLTPRQLGQSGGTETVTLTSDQSAAHTHSYNVTNTVASSVTPTNSVQLATPQGADKMYVTNTSGLTPFTMAHTSTSSVGGNQPHDNTMPTLTVSFCIAFDGIYPTQQ